MGWPRQPQAKARDDPTVAGVSPIQFARRVQETCDRSELVLTYDIRILDDTIVKIRVVLTDGPFIDVFYNADSGKCSYALVEGSVRIYGADNAFIGWHVHPFDDPRDHVHSPEVSFGDFLTAVEKYVESEAR